MAIIQKKIRLLGAKGQKEAEAIFDSGSTYSCIQLKIAKILGHIEPLPEPKDFGTAEKGRNITAKERVTLDFELNGYRFSDEFMILEELSDPVIIGAKTLQAWRMKLDFEADEVIVDPKVTKLRLL